MTPTWAYKLPIGGGYQTPTGDTITILAPGNGSIPVVEALSVKRRRNWAIDSHQSPPVVGYLERTTLWAKTDQCRPP